MSDIISEVKKGSTHPLTHKNRTTLSSNRELQLAEDFVNGTDCNLFLTGKAGTGKTTFLHNLRKNTAKRMIITAPTGVAAINAGGVTLHSFFQLPFGPFVPGSEAYERSKQRQFRFSKEKKQIIKSLDLLVIDEISMVRSDLLDAVDAVLRRLRRNNSPFGGVQLLMIGDLYQLSPVARPEERQILQQHYESIYFFSSHALDHNKLFTIELKHIYRQSDVKFIELLNKVRDNNLDSAAVKDFNKRFAANLSSYENQDYITLTTHNRNADFINRTRLSALSGKEYIFEASISGEFPEHIFPTGEYLVLKKDAQVMFVRNDSSSDKLYYNGKIGRINKISDDNISVVCPGESEEIVVEPITWENIKYTMDNDKKEIKEETIGKFKQYPLKLAWAITIHKSQGLTFEKAIIDIEAAFTHGQIYVALSRCKTLDGIVLCSPMSSAGLATDEAVRTFSKKAEQNPPSLKQLENAKISYQQNLLLECYNFQTVQSRLSYFLRLLSLNSRIIHISGVSGLDEISEMGRNAEKDIFAISEKFRMQLRKIFENQNLPQSDALVLERISKASKWFQDKFELIFEKPMQNIHIETDNREIRKKINNVLNNLKQDICVKTAGIKSCENGFSPSSYLRAVSSAEIEFTPEKIRKSQVPSFTKSDIEHPELFKILSEWRYKKAQDENIAVFQVLHQRVLIQIVVCLPDNTADLRRISGVGKKTIARYGAELVEIVSSYRKKHGIKEVALPSSEKMQKKGLNKNAENNAREKQGENTEGESRTDEKIDEKSDSKKKKILRSGTKYISFDMFNKGMTIEEIANERGFVNSTIEGHLTSFVKTGELNINRLLSPEKQKTIKDALEKEHNNSLTAVKHILGDNFSYGEIKFIIAFQEYDKSINEQNPYPSAAI